MFHEQVSCTGFMFMFHVQVYEQVSCTGFLYSFYFTGFMYRFNVRALFTGFMYRLDVHDTRTGLMYRFMYRFHIQAS